MAVPSCIRVLGADMAGSTGKMSSKMTMLKIE